MTTAVILAAGRGSRLEGLFGKVPKPLIPLGGVPILLRTIEAMPPAIDRVVVVVPENAEAIRMRISDRVGGRSVVFKKQMTGYGTMIAFLSAAEFIDEQCLVVNGDCLYSGTDLALCWDTPNSVLLITGEEHLIAGRYPDVTPTLLTEEMPQMAGVKQKGWRTLNTGAYCLPPAFLRAEMVLVPGKAEYGLPHTLARWIRDGNAKLNGVIATSWTPVGTPREWTLACEALRLGQVFPG